MEILLLDSVVTPTVKGARSNQRQTSVFAWRIQLLLVFFLLQPGTDEHENIPFGKKVVGSQSVCL